MILSARAESIILSAPPAESMILSAPPEWRWATPVAQWAAGREAIALGDGTAVAQWCYILKVIYASFVSVRESPNTVATWA